MRKHYGIAALMSFASWPGDRGRVSVVAQQDEGVAAKAGEKIDGVGRKIKQGLEKAEDAVREGFHKTRDSVHSMNVMSRVYGRLHWDKALHACTLNLKVEDGVVTIRGAVPTQTAKNKAVTLAAETVGVKKVIDELSVPASEAWSPSRPRKSESRLRSIP